MIFDHIEWDEYNLDHATKRLTAAEIEQAIRNADGRNMNLSKDAPDRRRIRSATDGGKRVAVVIQLVSNGARPITGWAE